MEEPKVNVVQPLVIDNDQTLQQVFAWIMENVTMKSMQPSKPIYLDTDSSNDEENVDDPPEKVAYIYTFVANGSSLDNYYDGFDCDESSLPPRIVPENATLDTVVLLSYDLTLYNVDGPNHDKRGTKFPDVEFGDFHSTWKFEKGLLTIGKLADGIFRLKSHKFENWYEWVHGTLLSIGDVVEDHRKRVRYYKDSGYGHLSIDVLPESFAEVVDTKKSSLLVTLCDSSKEFRACLSVDHGS